MAEFPRCLGCPPGCVLPVRTVGKLVPIAFGPDVYMVWVSSERASSQVRWSSAGV